jgi:hypothetical protein
MWLAEGRVRLPSINGGTLLRANQLLDARGPTTHALTIHPLDEFADADESSFSATGGKDDH